MCHPDTLHDDQRIFLLSFPEPASTEEQGCVLPHTGGKHGEGDYLKIHYGPFLFHLGSVFFRSKTVVHYINSKKMHGIKSVNTCASRAFYAKDKENN